MIRFVLGVIVGVLLVFLFLWFGGGSTVKKVGEGLSETGRKMERMEETIKKEKDDLLKGAKKKIFKDEGQKEINR